MTFTSGQARVAEHVREDPQRQGLVAALDGEGGDDDLVEAQREGQQATGEQRGRQQRQPHVAEGLELVGAEVGGRLVDVRRELAHARGHVVEHDHDAEGGVGRHQGGAGEVDAEAGEPGVQRDAGDDAGQREGQHDQEAEGMAPEELVAGQGRGGERPEHKGDERGPQRDGDRVARARRVAPAAWRASFQWSSVHPEGGQEKPRDVAKLRRAT